MSDNLKNISSFVQTAQSSDNNIIENTWKVVKSRGLNKVSTNLAKKTKSILCSTAV